MRYTDDEKYQILKVVNKNDGNVYRARREYAALHPGRPVPSKTTFMRISRHMEQYYSLKRKKRTVVANVDQDLDILLHFQENPSSSIMAAANIFETTYYRIRSILKKHKYRPYKIRPVQKLTQGQKEQRVNFCVEMINLLNADNQFLNNIIWTDESSFSTSGCYNRRNVHLWDRENPNAIKEIKTQGRQTLNVWCGIFHNRVLGPIFFDGHMTGPQYLNLLQNDIDHIINNDLPNQENLIWQQDGAPWHCTRPVREYLSERFPLWIGRNGPIPWPGNSPDLTVMDTFLWGYLKNKIYEKDHDDLNIIRQRITEEINRLNNEKSYMIINSLGNLRRRLELCRDLNGQHFEQYSI